MEFPNPAKPKEIDHGDADGGFNFPGSAGFIWQARSIMIAKPHQLGTTCLMEAHCDANGVSNFPGSPASSGRHASVPLPVSDCLAAASASRTRPALSGRRFIRQVHSSVLEAVAAACACLPAVRCGVPLWRSVFIRKVGMHDTVTAALLHLRGSPP